MHQTFGNPRLRHLIHNLQQQSQQRHRELKQSLHSEKIKLSKSCKAISPHNRPTWSHHLHRNEYFHTEVFLPYKYVPRHKRDQLVLPDRAVEKGAKRLEIKMRDSSVHCFPMSEEERGVRKRQGKEKVIENRKLMELNRILEAADGRLRKNKFEKRAMQRFVAAARKIDYFQKCPSFSREHKIPEGQLLRKISLTRVTQPNGWRPTTQMSKQFSKTALSKTSSNFLLTKPQDTFDNLDLF